MAPICVEVVGQPGADLSPAEASASTVPPADAIAARQRAKPGLGRRKPAARPFTIGPVVPVEQGQPDRHRVDVGRPQLRHQHQVAARLAHLLAVQPDHPGVDVVPVANGCLAGQGLGVRGRVFVVRKDQVRPAALHVEASCRARCCRAMTLHSMCQPGRPGPERGVPVRLARPPAEPEQRVERVGVCRPGCGSPPRSANRRQHRVAVIVRLRLPKPGAAATGK